jgi:hypothetical protein
MSVKKGMNVVVKQDLIVGEGLIVEGGLQGEVQKIQKSEADLRDYVIVQVEGLDFYVPANHFDQLFDIIKEDIQNV